MALLDAIPRRAALLGVVACTCCLAACSDDDATEPPLGDGSCQSGVPPAATPLPSVSCTHYVDGATGDDSNDGASEAQPWATIQHAADSVQAGQTVCIRAGTYQESVRLEVEGQEDQLITFAAYPGEDVLIDGTGINLDDGDSHFGLFDIRNCAYVRVTGLRLENSTWSGILARRCEHLIIDHNTTRETVSSGVGVWRTDDARVEANEIIRAVNSHDGSEEWLTMGTGTNFVIRGNVIHDGWYDDIPYPLGIDAKHSQGGVIEDNIIYDLGGTAIYIDGWNAHTHDITVRNNFLYGVSKGVSLGSERGGLVEHIDIYNNVIWSATYCGIILTTVSDDGPRERIRIFNNTIAEALDNGGAGIFIDTTNVWDVVIRNNIVDFASSDGVQGNIRATSPAGIIVDHNLTYGESGFADHELATPVDGEPGFVAPAAIDPLCFRLQPGSPAIDAGLAGCAPSFDFTYAPRPVDGDGNGQAQVDVGAFEYAP